MYQTSSQFQPLVTEPCFDTLGEDDGPPILFEIERALKKLKNHKSTGVDGIYNEQLKYGTSGLLTLLSYLATLFSLVGTQALKSGLNGSLWFWLRRVTPPIG